MKAKQKKELIFLMIANREYPEKTVSQLKNIRRTMLNHHEFDKLTAKTQFDICVTIGLIAIQTASYDLGKARLIPKDVSELEYAIQREEL